MTEFIQQTLYPLFKQSKGVVTDTRVLPKDKIFFALKGHTFDGNQFALQAIENGALAAVVDDESLSQTHPLIHSVEDGLTALQQLAQYHRTQLSIPVIGLTGSNGKTTSKELMVAVLTTQKSVQYTKGNLNNHIGVPLTLLSIDSTHEMAVVEMGANHQKEIEMLCEIAQPTLGYITNFGKAHLEGFGGVEGVIKGKTELYQFLKSHGGKVLINTTDPIQMEHAKDMDVISFGDGQADFPIETITQGEFCSVLFEGQPFHSQLVGDYNIHNIGAAIAIGKHFGVQMDNIKKAIAQYTPTNQRSQLIHTSQGFDLILDAYNANPSSVESSLNNLFRLKGEKAVILGDMFELGEYESAEHQKILEWAKNHPEIAFMVIGKAFNEADRTVSAPNISSFIDKEDFVKQYPLMDIKAEYLLLKGSRAMALETLLDLWP